MTDTNNLWNLKNDIDAKKAADIDTNADNFDKEKMMTLTPEEKAALDKMIAEHPEDKMTEIAVHETAPDGSVTNIPIMEYAKSLDERMDELHEVADTDKIMKLVNNGDITRSLEQLKADGRNKALEAFRSMSVNDAPELADDDYIAINDAGIEALQKYFNMDRLDSDVITKKMMKLNLRQIASIFPKQFLDIYLTEDEIRRNDTEARERFITTVAYLTVTGPELDYLNDYIDNENKLMLVSNRLIQCQSDLMEMIKSPEKLSEITAKTIAISPIDTSFWAKYIKGGPNKVHNVFAQRAVIQGEYKKAYEGILDEYPELPEDDPEYELREKSRALIQNEIDEAGNKSAAYISVMNLELMKQLWDNLVDRYKNRTKYNYKFLEQEAIDALDRIRKSKQNVPFPVYDKKFDKRPNELYKHYITEFPKMLEKYNEILINIKSKEPDAETNVQPIRIDGIGNNTVLEVFSMLLLVLYGRIMKKLTSSTSDKYDAIMLDSYFQIYCQIGSDIYLMTDIWNMMKDFVDYSISQWCCASVKIVK